MQHEAVTDRMGTALVASVWPARQRADWLRQAVLVLAGAALIAAGAQIKVPMWPVPMTMQTFAVLLLGGAYGLRLGVASVVLYLIAGAAGLPVITGALIGPTTGYLIGFVLAAGTAGALADRGWFRTLAGSAGALLLASLLIYVPGVLWLHGYIPSWEHAVMVGVVPFLVGDAVKLALAAALIRAGSR